MNYLAHASLAESSEEARLGSLLGDFSKGLRVELLSPTMERALDEHRAIDKWFDALPEIRAMRATYPQHLRRFGGILIDVFFDHFLVLHWDTLRDEPLAHVTKSLYDGLARFPEVLPPRLAEVAPSMAQNDWLGSYGDPRNVERALAGIAGRMKRRTPILEGVRVLEDRRAEIEALVLDVFPRVAAFVETRRADGYPSK